MDFNKTTEKPSVTVYRAEKDKQTHISAIEIDQNKVLSADFRDIALVVLTECLAGNISAFVNEKKHQPESFADVEETFTPAIERTRKELADLGASAAKMMFSKFLREENREFVNKAVADATAICNSLYEKAVEEEEKNDEQ